MLEKVKEMPNFFYSSTPEQRLGSVIMNFTNNKPFKPPRGKEAAQEQNLFLKLQYTKKGIDLVILAISLAKRSSFVFYSLLS